MKGDCLAKGGDLSGKNFQTRLDRLGHPRRRGVPAKPTPFPLQTPTPPSPPLILPWGGGIQMSFLPYPWNCSSDCTGRGIPRRGNRAGNVSSVPDILSSCRKDRFPSLVVMVDRRGNFACGDCFLISLQETVQVLESRISCLDRYIWP